MRCVDFDDELEKWKESESVRMPKVVRSRIDETYKEISSMEAPPAYSRSARPVRKRGVKAAAVSALAITLLGASVVVSGYISPAVAQSLERIPLLGSLFQKQDAGLQIAGEHGLFTPVDASDTHDGVTLKVSSVMYDGVRVSMVVQRESSVELETTLYEAMSNHNQGNTVFFDITYEGQSMGGGLSDTGERDAVIVTAEDTGYEKDGVIFSDKFNLFLSLGLEGIDEPFEFMVPVVKNVPDNYHILKPGISKTYEHLEMTLQRIAATPVTTELDINVKADMNEVPEKYQAAGGFLNLDYELVDDLGKTVKFIGGRGSSSDEENEGVYSRLKFEPLDGDPKALTLKPYIYIRNGEETAKEYIKELEMTVSLDTKKAAR